MKPRAPQTAAEFRTARRRAERRSSDSMGDAQTERSALIAALDSDTSLVIAKVDRMAETALLIAQNGDISGGLRAINETRTGLPQSVRLAYVLSRINRIAARAERVTYSADLFRTLNQPIEEFRSEIPGSLPLARLTSVSLAFSMTDGDALAARRRRHIEELTDERTLIAGGTSRFEQWWLDQVTGKIGLRTDDLTMEDTESGWASNERTLNQLEEDFANRLLAPLVV